MIRTFELLDKLVEFGTVVFFNTDGLPERWQGQYIDSTSLVEAMQSSMPFARHLLLMPGRPVNEVPDKLCFLIAPPDSEILSIADMDRRLMSEPFYRQRRAKVFSITFGPDVLRGDIHIGKTGTRKNTFKHVSQPEADCLLCGTCLSVCPMYTSFSIEKNILTWTPMNRLCLERHTDIQESRRDFNLFRLNSINCSDCGNCLKHCPITESRELCHKS